MGQHLASELAHGSTAETGRQTRLRDKRLQCSTLGIVIGERRALGTISLRILGGRVAFSAV